MSATGSRCPSERDSSITVFFLGCTMHHAQHTVSTATTRQPRDAVFDPPFVSVVIISKGNHATLAKAIASLKTIDYPASKMQVVVLEETQHPEPFESWVEYHTIPVQNLGFGYARNRALSYATNPIIIFTDDDCTFDPHWISHLTLPLLQSQKIAAVSGAVYVPECGSIGQCENIIGFPGGGMRYVHLCGGNPVAHPTFSTCNCALRRSAIDDAGGFNASMKYGGEDEQISRHIAKTGTILYQPAAIVYHQPRDSFHGVFNWFVRRGYADIHHALIDNKSSYSFKSFLKNAIILRFAVLLLLATLSGYGVALMLPIVFIYYGLLLFKFRWSLRYYHHVRTFLLVPVVRTVMDTGRDWGIVKGLLSIKKTGSKEGVQDS